MAEPPFEPRRSRRLREAAAAAATPPSLPGPPPGQLPGPRHPSSPIVGPHEPDDAAEAPEERRMFRLVLPAVAALLLLWSLTTLVGDVSWGPLSILPVGLACLSPLLAVPALIVMTMAARRHNWVALVPALAAGVLPWVFVVGNVIPAEPPAGPTVPLRALLVTAHDGAADAAEIAFAARSQRADVVVVTELSPTLAHNLTRSGLARALPPRYVSVPENAPADGLAIYSRFPVDQIQALPGTRWPAVRARVMIDRTPVTLVAGHTVRPSSDRLDAWRRDLRVFGSAARIKGPVLVLANLNATPWNPQYRRIVSGRLHDAADVLGRGLRPTWPNWSPVPVLPTDHALVAGAGVTSLGTVAITGTDHRALSVELQLPR